MAIGQRRARAPVPIAHAEKLGLSALSLGLSHPATLTPKGLNDEQKHTSLGAVAFPTFHRQKSRAGAGPSPSRGDTGRREN
jgi:hypothetical protein